MPKYGGCGYEAAEYGCTLLVLLVLLVENSSRDAWACACD
jgi:hypothetical protein